MSTKRTAVFISDRTGITVEMLGNSLLSQFDHVHFNRITLPFVDTLEKAQLALEQIKQIGLEEGTRPIVFCTLVNSEVRNAIHGDNALFLDLFEIFIIPLEKELGQKSSHTVGKSHSAGNVKDYNARIEAVNYTLSHDDGQSHKNLDDADIILVGVSRSGKTPTCLYLALQFGIKAANYPLIPEDLDNMKLPPALAKMKHKIYGLTITPERLAQIRTERKPDSNYASLANCRRELSAAEALMRQAGIRFIESTTKSIEELATTIMHETQLARRVF
jgi:[pyruvate, water dikinase]-phosphate phosphotransferase / [pyruvate, water dikinase] kinase